MRARDTEARRVHRQEYCERLRAELLDAGHGRDALDALGAGALSDLVITTRRAHGMRCAGSDHPSTARR